MCHLSLNILSANRAITLNGKYSSGQLDGAKTGVPGRVPNVAQKTPGHPCDQGFTVGVGSPGEANRKTPDWNDFLKCRYQLDDWQII